MADDKHFSAILCKWHPLANHIIPLSIKSPLWGLLQFWHTGTVYNQHVVVSVIFVNENENSEKRENNEFVNEN